MPEETSSPDKISANDLPFVVYLNQRVVLDLLATLEGGFSQLSKIEVSDSASSAGKRSAEGGLGISNVFALLGVTLKGATERQHQEGQSTTVSLEKVHTPTSLFARLRSQLVQRGLLATLGTDSDIEGTRSGCFVEFTASISTNPLLSTMATFRELMSLASGLEQKPTHAARRASGSSEQNSKQVLKQMESVESALTSEGSVDLIATVRDTSITAVLVTDMSYFNDPTLNELIDGDFSVMAKVTRVVSPADQPINLLRKTSFGKLQPQILEQMMASFATAEDAGIRLPEMRTQVQGPALQVMPIAIYA